MIKRFVIALILVAAVAGGLIAFNIFRDQAIQDYFANAPQPTVTVSAVTVDKGVWTPTIEAIGTVKAASGIDLTVETAGIAREIRFETNQRVEKGQLLVQLEDAVQRADLEAAGTQAELDQQSLERALELQKRGVGSSVSVETARAAASASRSQVAKLQAVLDQKQLKAPFSGYIGLPQIDAGQYVTPGTTVATLQDLDTMHADFTVPEQQLGNLAIGRPVRLGSTGDDMRFTGEITGIDPKVDPATRLVSARAVISNPEDRLSPGQFVQVRVELPEEEGVVALPQTALVTSLYGDYVYVVRDADDAADTPGDAPSGTAPADGEATAAEVEAEGEDEAGDDKEQRLVLDQVFVETGRRSGGAVEIVEGLSVGQRVVTAGQNRLSNGMPVTVDNTINPGGETDLRAASK